MAFKGIFPYIVTPVDQQFDVREDTLYDLVEHLITSGVHGLSPLGSTGEVAYLTSAQRLQVVRATVKATAGRVPVVAGVAAHSTHDAIQQIHQYQEAGVDGVVLILQTYFPLPPQAIKEFFHSVAMAVHCPIVIYSNPKFLGYEISPELILQLSDAPNIQYIKDASGILGNILSIINLAGERIKVFSASAHIPLIVQQLGGVGWMAGPACLLPKQCIQLYELTTAGQWDEALALQQRLWRINEVFQRYSLAACVKAGLEIQGFAVGKPIAPQLPLSPKAYDDIREVLELFESE